MAFNLLSLIAIFGNARRRDDRLVVLPAGFII